MNFLALFKLRFRAKAQAGPRLGGTGRETGPAARSRLSAQSETLSSEAHAWVRQLPVPARPLELCNVYPRVANRIARYWNDLAMTDAVFDDLQVDHRGGRKGFPAPVAVELVRLQALHEERGHRAGSTTFPTPDNFD